MGNLCGKPSKDDHFNGPGRVLGSAPAPSNNARATVPKIATITKPAQSPQQPQGRTLGNSSGGGGDDAKSAAAKAAEARAQKASSSSGDLAKKLEAQKRQTREQTLKQVSYENRAARDADAAQEARNYN
ncbi:hypothetical protein GQ43DRAFT_402060 [Delitschia confertaspora ATCC 74209]|uniref:Uncharacterized protein n=1 Tax=Delitschia confertaspora ATCC 74209 TaxID=1513339 RepID=A0A9P4JEY7_9PLEO|nr:hypothetical protein GQ43DRAFT_402060 [Delitschia confertaspora ATCC 74209]